MATVTATATAVLEEIEIGLEMPGTTFGSGDPCKLI